MTPFGDFTAAILNGGDGSRLGGVNKALIKVGGETIISRTINTLTPLFNKIILAGNSVPEELMKCLTPVNDRFPGSGPLAGIDAALTHTTTRYLFVFAGDMPWLSAELIKRQIEFFLENPCDVLIPRVNYNIEPLHSIINKSIAPELEKYLTTNINSPVRAFFQCTDLRFYDVNDADLRTNSFKNINTNEDLCL